MVVPNFPRAPEFCRRPPQASVVHISCAILALLGLGLGCQSTAASPAARPAAGSPTKAARYRRVNVPLSGWEQCYNAWDDNENGLIDEGCGVAQAPIVVLVAWDDAEVDLDLMVFDPKGEVATQRAPTESGLSLEQDCPGSDECGDQPFEIVYSSEAEYSAGTYRVLVVCRRLDPESRPLSARLGIHTPETTYSYSLEFFEQTQSVDLAFEVAGPPQKN